MYMASRQGDWGIPPTQFLRDPPNFKGRGYSYIDKEEKILKFKKNARYSTNPALSCGYFSQENVILLLPLLHIHVYSNAFHKQILWNCDQAAPNGSTGLVKSA